MGLLEIDVFQPQKGNNKMKRILTLLIVAALIASLSSCEKKDVDGKESQAADQATQITIGDGIDWVEEGEYDLIPQIAQIITIQNTALYQRLYDAIEYSICI